MATLITGINGFAAYYLAKFLHEQGERIEGTTFGNPPAEVPPDVFLSEIDLTEPEQITELIAERKPEKIYHLAGFAAVGATSIPTRLVYEINLIGTVNLFEAIDQAGINARVVQISSADVYGQVDDKDLPTRETYPFNPESHYAASKTAAEMAAQNFRARSNGKIELIVVRPFNHIGPRQRGGFVCPDFFKRVKESSDGGSIEVGNLHPLRNFSDVRDIVRGYQMAMEKGKDGEIYQLASDQVISVGELLEKIQNLFGKKLEPVKSGKYYRPIDPSFYGSAQKARGELGWKPDYLIDETLQFIYDQEHGKDGD